MNETKTIALLIGVIFIGGLAAAYPTAAAAQQSDRASAYYERGTDAVDDDDWQAAIANFTRVVELKSDRSDGALFWTAYALNKLGRRAEALRTIATLRKAYPESRWSNDAQALEVELRQARGETVSPDRVTDDDVKMIAINSLMHTDPEKAYPLLEKIVQGPSDPKIKKRALFILSQSGSSRAQTLLGSIARGAHGNALQQEAVKYLGISGSERNRQVLADIYASTSSPAVKKQVLDAFMISNDRARVVAAARSEKDPRIRKDAIRLLGIMNATADLASLYGTDISNVERKEIITALFISGDTQRLGELARTERNVTLRKEAIEKLGLMGTKTAGALQSLYASETDVEAKKAILKAFFLQSNARALIDISKKETNRTLRSAAVRHLSLINDDEAIAYLLQVINE